MLTTREFCDRYDACGEAREWATGLGIMDAPMVSTFRRADLRYEWRLWALTRPGVYADRDLRLFACRCVRETPLADGRTVWDLLTDPRSRAAIEVAERYARGEATTAELAAARDAAGAAARDAAGDAAGDAAWAAAGDAAWAAARAAQATWMLELPVIFE